VGRKQKSWGRGGGGLGRDGRRGGPGCGEWEGGGCLAGAGGGSVDSRQKGMTLKASFLGQKNGRRENVGIDVRKEGKKGAGEELKGERKRDHQRDASEGS